MSPNTRAMLVYLVAVELPRRIRNRIMQLDERGARQLKADGAYEPT